MPVELTSTASAVFVVTASGDVTFADVAAVIEELLDDSRAREGVTLLVDGRTVERVPSTVELRLIAQALKPLRDKGVAHIAIVAGSAFVYGIARMFAVFAESVGMSVAVFRCKDEAERWLVTVNVAA